MKCDCHMHMVLDGVSWKSAIARHENGPDDAFIRQALARYQVLGYTYLRDGGDRWDVGKRARELAPEYGIRYRTPLSPLCKVGHYGVFIGEKYEDFREYRLLVEKMRAQGADFIKIMISGLMDFDRFGVLTQPGLPPQDIRELIHIAHEEGFPVMAHANGARTVEAASAAGVDSVEHGAYLDDDALAAMAEAGIECAAVSPEHAKTLAEAAGKPLTVHIKLDTGMHRVGFSCDTEERTRQTVRAITEIAGDKRLHIGGIFTHFACCDDEMLDGLTPVPEGQLTEIQFGRYRRVLELLEGAGVDAGLRHASNSAAILGYAPAWLDAVRAGIILYGMTPDGRSWRDDRFRPVMTLETTVAHIQTLRCHLYRRQHPHPCHSAHRLRRRLDPGLHRCYGKHRRPSLPHRGTDLHGSVHGGHHRS